MHMHIQVVAGNIAFNGGVKFVDNDVKTFDGGALYLLSFSQFTLYPGAHLDFTNNAGRYTRLYAYFSHLCVYIAIRVYRQQYIC